MRSGTRLSERLLRLVVRDAEAYQGLLGDLHEEASRSAEPRRRFAHDRAVLGMARGYLAAQLLRRRGTAHAPGRGDREGWLRAATGDVRIASRLLRRRPAYTASVVATLGLGFGAAAAVLSVAYGVWLRPLPFGDAERIVRVYEVKREGSEGSVAGDAPMRPGEMDAEVARRSRLSPPLLDDVRTREWENFAEFAAVAGLAVDWRDTTGASRRLSGVSASRGVFEVLQLRPVVGRFFAPTPGSAEVVLGESLWRGSFGADRDVIGRDSLVLDGSSYLIIGVAPDDLPYPESEAEVWLPSDPSANELVEGMRGARYLDVVARMRPHATLAAGVAELDSYIVALAEIHPNHVGWGATAVPLRIDLVRPFAGILRALVASAALFLLIACSNAAGLVAARRARHLSERHLRLALGASRWRLLRHELAEMLWLSVGSAAVAALLATWILTPLRRLAPADLPRIADIHLDPLVLGAMIALLLCAGLFAAVMGSTTGGGTEVARDSYRSVTGAAPTRAALTVLQVALTTLLLVAGAAMVGHFVSLARIAPGFEPDGVMAAPILMSEANYPDGDARLRFFHRVLDGLEQRGHAAAIGVNPPMAGVNMRFGYRAGDWEAEQFWGQYHTVSGGYFRVLGIELLAGRAFNERDRADAAPIVIINEALARAHFDGDPVGREMIVVGTTREIVGVVASVRHFGPDQPPPPEMYVPLAQDPWLLGHIVVHPGTGFSADDARAVVATVDAEVPVPAMVPYDQFVGTWFAPLRFQMTIVALLAVAGMVLAAMGLYALIAYVVAGQVREIGIRVALGATAGSVFARVLVRGLGLAAAGLAIGLLGVVVLRGVGASLGVSADPSDLRVVLTVVVAVMLAAAAACFVPARRAAAVDPTVALRGS